METRGRVPRRCPSSPSRRRTRCARGRTRRNAGGRGRRSPGRAWRRPRRGCRRSRASPRAARRPPGNVSRASTASICPLAFDTTPIGTPAAARRSSAARTRGSPSATAVRDGCLPSTSAAWSMSSSSTPTERTYAMSYVNQSRFHRAGGRLGRHRRVVRAAVGIDRRITAVVGEQRPEDRRIGQHEHAARVEQEGVESTGHDRGQPSCSWRNPTAAARCGRPPRRQACRACCAAP